MMTGEEPTRPARKTGLAHLLAAASYTGAGLRRLLKESACRQELIIGLLLVVALAVLGTSLTRLIGFVVLFLVLVAAEALNTAVEVLVNHLSPEWSEFARDAKDLGSVAVGALLLACGIYWVWAVFA